jgi:hypothetical protein|tara:strand:- start:418 stop:573 length:156 start_codon:yes stop_codon:yes gene_type:complete
MLSVLCRKTAKEATFLSLQLHFTFSSGKPFDFPKENLVYFNDSDVRLVLVS